VITLLALGAGIGAGLWSLLVWAAPPRPDLGLVLARLDPIPHPTPLLLAAAGDGWAIRAAAPLTRVLAGLGLPRTAVRRDLIILERSIPAHLAHQAVLATAGLFLPAVGELILLAVGSPVGWAVPVWVGLLTAAAGLMTPDVQVRARAARRRADLRHALSAFLDLVVVSLAGGAGVDGALTDSASIGHGWAFTQIRCALDAARLARATPWSMLGRLGTELDIGELVELAASVSLAGTEGAKVRASLAAKAAALRGHQLADAEAAANAATERMSLPVVALFGGFLLFIGYPAVGAVLGGL